MDEDGNDLLEEILLMIAYNFDALLGEERRNSGGVGISIGAFGSAGGSGGGLGSVTSVSSPPYASRPALSKSPVSPKLRSPVSSASTPRDDPDSSSDAGDGGGGGGEQ